MRNWKLSEIRGSGRREEDEEEDETKSRDCKKGKGKRGDRKDILI
jgi:hypothetical protein